MYRDIGLALRHFRPTSFHELMTLQSKVNNFWDPEIGRFDIKHSIFISSTSLGLQGLGKKIHNNFYVRWAWRPHDNALVVRAQKN
jgi:hypothetical protein